METLRTDTVHTTDSIHSLSCINTHHIDEISKEKEDELLYGTGDDGDEEDALSDDSMRLRLSDDDEPESDDVLTSILDEQQNDSKRLGSEVTSGEKEDEQASTVPEKSVGGNDTTAREISEEEQCSGSFYYRPFPSSSNHVFRTRQPRGYYKNRTHDYSHRFYNTFLPFEQGRRSGKFNSHCSPIYGYRQQNKPFQHAAMKKINATKKSDQNHVSPSNTNVSSRSEFDKNVDSVNVNVDKTIDENNTLDSDHSISNEKNVDANQVLSESVEDTPIEDCNNESLTNTVCVDNSSKSQPEVKSIEESSEMISLSNDTECKDVIIVENNVFNESSRETIANSLTNCHENSKEMNEDKISTNNVDSDCSDISGTNNSKILEKLLTEGTRSKSDNDEVAECIKKDNVNNEMQSETITIDLDVNESEHVEQINKPEEHELDTNQQSVDVNQRIETTESNCETVSNNLEEEKLANNKSTVNKELENHNVEEIVSNKKEDRTVQNMTLSESNEINVLEGNDVVNNSIHKESDMEVDVMQSDALDEPLVYSAECDKNKINNNDNSTNSTELTNLIVPEDQSTKPQIEIQEQKSQPVDKNAEPIKNESLPINSDNKTSEVTENVGSSLNKSNLSDAKSQNGSLMVVTDIKDSNDDSDKKNVEVPVTTVRRRRRTKKMMMLAAAHENIISEEAREGGRQKRRTAKNAEEIIRKKFLNHDSDLESSDGSEKFVIVNHRMNQDARPLSPPSLKRNCPDADTVTMNGGTKKLKINPATLSDELSIKQNDSQNIKKLDYVRKFFQRDLKEKLPKLKQEELEELLIQKIVETITMRGEIGKLREQARISERNQEVTRAKCQQLAKQIKDFEMVLIRNAADRRANNDKPTPPIKINRSVGLQVNFISDHGMQNLRQLQQNSNMKSVQVTNNNTNSSPSTPTNEKNNATSPRRGIKVRSPRRIEPATGQTAVVSQSHTQSPNIMSTITPAALVVAKPMETQHTLTIPNQSNIQQIISNQQPQAQPQSQPQQPQQTIVLNGKFPNQMNRQSTPINIAKSKPNDLIDLTDEEEKSKAATTVPVVTTTVTDQQINITQKTTQPCFQRVIQTIPGGNVAITSQPPSIRVVQPASQPTPTALVNNMNARLAYVMQSGVGPARQLLIAPNSTPMRPVTSCTRASFSTLTYKTGISTIANGTVRVLTTSATSNVQFHKHPAPLPDTRNYAVNPLWKLPPPAPSLKISKVANGIVLSWNMNLSDKYADIASYQLYAYQEVAGIPPNTSLWKKVGDVRALPLPMACTLTQFSEGNNYYFAVRAVDTHSRKGQYSIPGNISL
ncbi:fibronectin-III type domain-containing protein windei isoform X2 [Calliopsis andreniformis]|uniref:fibronectin-III type domain-containing protein windei isoform X2 n=1 Tax=Calliopsis andreniformis TaxID=337506 RepID=UPI003FCE006B